MMPDSGSDTSSDEEEIINPDEPNNEINDENYEPDFPDSQPLFRPSSPSRRRSVRSDLLFSKL